MFLRRLKTAIAIPVLALVLAITAGLIACRKSASNTTTVSNNPSVANNAINSADNKEAKESKTLPESSPAEDDEKLVKNFDRAMGELDAITVSCDEENW